MLYLTDILSRSGLTLFYFFWKDIKEKRIWERVDYGVDWEEWRKGTMQSGYNAWEKNRRKIKDLPLSFGNWNFNFQASNNYGKLISLLINHMFQRSNGDSNRFRYFWELFSISTSVWAYFSKDWLSNCLKIWSISQIWKITEDSPPHLL